MEFTAVLPTNRELAAEGATVARITSLLVGRSGLLNSLARQLSFPSSFREDWDALEVSLVDAMMNQGRNIAIVHEGIPTELSSNELKAYVHVLETVLKSIQSSGDPPLRAIFAENIRPLIEASRT